MTAGPEALASLSPEPGLERQSAGVSSDSPRSIATVSSSVGGLFDPGRSPSDRQQQRARQPRLRSFQPLPAVQPGRVEPPFVMEATLPDEVAWCAVEYCFGDWASWMDTKTSDKEAPSSFLSEEDQAFWQALMSQVISGNERSAR